MSRIAGALAVLLTGSLALESAALAQSGHAGHGASVAQPAPAEAVGQRRILYYRNPMGLPDTSPVPKKDPMGMDYVAVYEGEEAGAGVVTISPEKVQKLGVRTELVGRRTMGRQVRAVGTVQVDERRLFVVAPKFEAWIEKLHVDTTGATVRRGQPLMEVYSPELVLAQQEYLVARRAGGSDGLADASLQRLRNLDVPEEDIERLRRTGKASRTLVYRAAADGVVLEKAAVRGMRFMPGEPLYRIADLSQVWLIADVFEQDLGQVQLGHDAEAVVNALPGRVFSGTIGFIYPTLTAESRTGKVRIDLANPEGLLKPNLYATVNLHNEVVREPAVVVPESALLDTGRRQVVLVETGEGRYEPREVKTGARADGYVQIFAGLEGGERVVVRANFLIDSESNLRAALSGFGGGGQHQHQ